MIQRLQEFLHEFLKNNDKGDYYLVNFISLLDGAGNYGHNLYENETEVTPNSKELNQKSKLIFEFVPSDPLFINSDCKQEYNVRSSFFQKFNKFNIMAENSVKFDDVKDFLLKIINKDGLNAFGKAFRYNNPSLLLKNSKLTKPNKPDNNLELIVTINNLKIDSNLLVIDIMHKYGRVEDIKFKFVPNKLMNKRAKFMSEQSVIYKEIVKEAQNIGVVQNNKIVTYLKVLKFLYLVNTYLPNLTSCASIMFKNGFSKTIQPPVHEDRFKSNKISIFLSRFLHDDRSQLPS